ncbi:hypothetical protein LCGC14_2249670 [marine sediment metagenome]|uniref:Uncharacterized protein n=1 Tax=marine sediment metagenome TaxID=412755 RepID=A0A0F9FFI8_9ZZZZ
MFRAIMLKGKAHQVWSILNTLAEQHPTRTIGEITENTIRARQINKEQR